MKKTVLYLMNGFGIEQKDSYNIYNSNLMPNLDSYTKDYLFSSVETNAFDLMNGYRYFSTGSKYSLTYPFIDQFSNNYDANPNMKALFERIPKEFNLHLFVFLQNSKAIDHLKTFLTYIKSKCENTVYLHLILDSKNTNDYKEYERIITKMNYDLKDYPINTIVGKNILKNKSKDYVAILNHGIGEKWRETSKKFSSLQTLGTIPENVEPFFVNDKFEFKETDQIFFFNYELFDCTNFTNDLNKYNKISKSFSMFPLTGVQYPLFAFPTSSLSMNKTIKDLDTKALMVMNSKDMPVVNYYCNGLNNIISQNILYTKSDKGCLSSKEYMSAVLNNPQFDLIVINDSIEQCKSIDELNGRLKEIDNSIKIVHDICEDKEYTLFISSLYGINKEFVKDNFTKCTVNFSGKVPVIIKDNIYNKSKFYIDYGDIYTLANTVYKNMNLKYVGDVFIKKKTALNNIIKK